MKVIVATSIVPTTVFIIYFFITMQFVYAQTVENEIIENTLERIDNTTTIASISQITESLNSASESKKGGTTQTTTNINNITGLLFDKYFPIVKVDYESDSMVVLEGNENYLSQINGSLVPFWESIDIVKNQEYSLKEIITSGTGSIEDPIIFYAIFFNNSNNKIEK